MQEPGNDYNRLGVPWSWHCCCVGRQFHRCTQNDNVSFPSWTVTVRNILDKFFYSCSRHGLPDSIQTYGLVSGLWTSTFALGAFVGPSVSGLLYDSIGFREAVIFIIVLHAVVGLVGLIAIMCERTPQPYKEVDATEPLLKSHDSLFYNDKA